MKKRHRTKQTTQMEHLKSTFLVRKYVSELDLAVIQKPSNFPESVKKDRRYNDGVDHAKLDLKMLGFFLRYLKPRYRMKILNSKEFKNVLENILAFSPTTLNDYTNEERAKALILAYQLIEYSRHVIQSQMPKEFRAIIAESSKPFIQLVTAISDYGSKANRKDIPRLESIDFVYDPKSSIK